MYKHTHKIHILFSFDKLRFEVWFHLYLNVNHVLLSVTQYNAKKKNKKNANMVYFADFELGKFETARQLTVK